MAVISRELKAIVQDLMQLLEATGNIIAVVNKLMKVLEEAGLIYRVRLHPSLVIVHRENRDGCGVGAHDVHELLDILADVGFDHELIDAVCIEVDPKDIIFNEVLINEADGTLGSPADLSKARFASVGASHTNWGLRCINAQTPHTTGKGKLVKDGKLCPAVVSIADPPMGHACAEGLHWRVVRAEAVAEWPELPDLIQQRGNTKAERGEHPLQICKRMHNLILSEGRRLKRRVNFVDIKDKAARSKPKCAVSLS